MAARHNGGRGAWLLAACLGACAATPAPAGAQAVPDDFQLVARYAPGYSTWRSWKTTITADGKALQEVGRGGRGGGQPFEKKAALSKDDLRALVARVKQAVVPTLRRAVEGKDLSTDHYYPKSFTE